MDFITYSLIIDDIVLPDGRTAMGVLGGGGPQTAFGMKVWADSVGLVGGIGHDFPIGARRWLDGMEIDTAGLRRFPQHASLRSWQVFDWDGRRTQVWRTRGQAVADQLALRFADLPASYQTARAFHLGVHPENPDLAVIDALRAQGMFRQMPTRRPAIPWSNAALTGSGGRGEEAGSAGSAPARIS